MLNQSHYFFPCAPSSTVEGKPARLISDTSRGGALIESRSNQVGIDLAVAGKQVRKSSGCVDKWKNLFCSYLQSAPLLIGQPVVGKKKERVTNKQLTQLEGISGVFLN